MIQDDGQAEESVNNHHGVNDEEDKVPDQHAVEEKARGGCQTPDVKAPGNAIALTLQPPLIDLLASRHNDDERANPAQYFDH